MSPVALNTILLLFLFKLIRNFKLQNKSTTVIILLNIPQCEKTFKKHLIFRFIWLLSFLYLVIKFSFSNNTGTSLLFVSLVTLTLASLFCLSSEKYE